MTIYKYIIYFMFLLVQGHLAAGIVNRITSGEEFLIKEFATLPVPKGYMKQSGLGGAFSGIIGQNIIIAGGSNFPDLPPWKGGQKKWWSEIYILSLDSIDKKFKIINQKLPHPLAYGLSVTLPEGILCIGGCNAEKTFNEVFLIHYTNSSVEFVKWPSLPVPLSNMCGALLDGKIYIAGGQEDINMPAATNYFFVLDIQDKNNGWQKLDSWPGPNRAFAVAASQSNGFDNCFYLFSGRNYSNDISLEVLYDGYEYNPRLKKWARLDKPDGPRFPVMAGTAVSSGSNHIIFFGGVDGILAIEEYRLRKELAYLEGKSNTDQKTDSIRILKEKILNIQENHPGFSRDILLYQTVNNTIIRSSTAPFSLPVTTNAVRSGNRYYITSGEIRPGIRTPLIFSVDQE